MTLTEPFVLHTDTVLVPVSELSEKLRQTIACEPGDFTIGKRNSRTQSKVIDSDAAALIREFEQPSTVAAAIARFSRGKDENAETLLEAAIPLVQSLIAGALLVPAASVREPSATTLTAGDHVDAWRIVRTIQAFEDTEIYQVCGLEEAVGALKICRAGHPAARRAIQREISVLRKLSSDVGPALLASGEHQGRPYLISEWLFGTEADRVSAELHRSADTAARRDLWRVAGAILKAYARLHECGVIHGDVHPRNILVEGDMGVKLLDLGFARDVDDESNQDAERAGISYFWEPELARALLGGMPPPPATFAGEQYSLGALLYLLLTGSHYADFVVEKDAMLREIAGTAMVPFAHRGIEPWPAAERLLERALCANPTERFASVADFAAAWDLVEVTSRESPHAAALHGNLGEIRQDLVATTAIQNEAIRTSMDPPTASINYGSAGIAFGLHRIACATGDGELFAQADCWSARALRDVNEPAAFHAPELDLTSTNVGSCSLYNGPAGVFAAAALIAAAREDTAGWDMAVRTFGKICQASYDVLDLTLGIAGALLGCALLLEVRDDPRLRAIGADLRMQLGKTIDDATPISESSEFTVLGIAHGWAGILYAVITWCVIADDPLPSALERRLRELSGCAYPIGRGLTWPRDLLRPTPNAEAWGWCNGSAGYVFLWSAAYRATGDRNYLTLADRAAWNVWEMPAQGSSLCCGMAGQVYALLNVHRHSGDERWLNRARQLATFAKALQWRRESLYKGDLGLAVLAADLENSTYARMPMFECDA